jgi:uncharacterized RDD family membrane protein YckC
MDHEQFSTPEDVELNYELAGPASRFGAFAYDRVLLLLLQLGMVLTMMLISFLAGGGIPTEGSIFIVILTVLVGFIEFLYFGVHEWRSNGLTPGKKKLGMRVAMDGGYSLTTTAVILRTLARPVDTIPIFWIIPLLDKKTRRLGDFLAGTLVMKVVNETSVYVPFADEDLSSLAVRNLGLGVAHLSRLQRSQYASIEEFLLREKQLSRKQRSALAKQIVGALLVQMELEPPANVASFELLKEIYLSMRKHSSLLRDD